MSPEELIEIATESESFKERRAAVEAMGVRKDITPYVDTLKNALYEEVEGSPAVRTQALRTIGRRPDFIKHYPYIIELLEWVEENDSSEFVREEAKETLNSFQIPDGLPFARHTKKQLTTDEEAKILFRIGAPFGKATCASIINPDKKPYREDPKKHPLYGMNWVIKGPPPEKPITATAKEDEDETTVMYSTWMPPDAKFEPE